MVAILHIANYEIKLARMGGQILRHVALLVLVARIDHDSLDLRTGGQKPLDHGATDRPDTACYHHLFHKSCSLSCAKRVNCRTKYRIEGGKAPVGNPELPAFRAPCVAVHLQIALDLGPGPTDGGLAEIIDHHAHILLARMQIILRHSRGGQEGHACTEIFPYLDTGTEFLPRTGGNGDQPQIAYKIVALDLIIAGMTDRIMRLINTCTGEQPVDIVIFIRSDDQQM